MGVRSAVILLRIATALPALACDDDAPLSQEPADPLVEIRDACSASASVWCDSHRACLPATFAAEYANPERCVAVRSAVCQRTEFGLGSTTTPASVRACASASDLSDRQLDDRCAEWLEREAARTAPVDCRAPGTAADGAPCVNPNQCASDACGVANTCGRCRQSGAGDDTCFNDSDCPRGSVCQAARCVTFSSAGAACGPDKPCLPHLTCRSGTCGWRAGAGEACDVDGDDCALWPEQLACSAGTCVPITFALEGEPCGDFDGACVRCAFGAACRVHEVPRRGTCVPIVAEGETCTFLPEDATPITTLLSFPYGGPCAAPAACIDYRCRALDAVACEGPAPP